MKINSILIILVILGGLMRFYNLNWDHGLTFHPDERNIAAAVTKINFFENLNPGFFAYGSFSIYLIRLVAEVATLITHDQAWLVDWGHINLIGRAISAAASTTSILFTWLLANKVFNKTAATIATALVTFSPSLIQTAHYGTTESLLTFFILAITLISAYVVQKSNLKTTLLAAVLFGTAVATKTTALSFAAPLVVSCLKNPKKLLGTLLVGAAVFLLFSPYTFLSWEKFLESMRYESGVITGKLRVVYVLQFENTLPYIFQLKNLVFQMGPVAIAGILGIVILVWQALKTKDKKLLIFLSFPLVYFAYVGLWYTKFVRYLVPTLPFLAIAAACFFLAVRQKSNKIGILLLVALTASSILWSAAFFLIYTKLQTRITASQWIYENIPPGARILGEHWDDGLPVPQGEKTAGVYAIEQLTIYESDNKQKVEYYAGRLSNADFIIINSRRLYGTLMNLPDKYPVTSKYYNLLFSGQLGYAKVAEFSSYPKIFGLVINDDASEETFQVYDHPRVLIFKNTGRLDKNALAGRLLANNE